MFDTAIKALRLVLNVGRGSSGRLIPDAHQELSVRDALALVESQATAVEGFTSGSPLRNALCQCVR